MGNAASTCKGRHRANCAAHWISSSECLHVCEYGDSKDAYSAWFSLLETCRDSAKLIADDIQVPHLMFRLAKRFNSNVYSKAHKIVEPAHYPWRPKTRWCWFSAACAPLESNPDAFYPELPLPAHFPWQLLSQVLSPSTTIHTFPEALAVESHTLSIALKDF